MNSTYCMVYQDTVFLWSCMKNHILGLFLLLFFPHLPVIFFIEISPISFLTSSFLIVSSLVHLFTDPNSRISVICNFCIYLFLFRLHMAARKQSSLCVFSSFPVKCSPNSAIHILEFLYLNVGVSTVLSAWSINK